MSTNRLLKSVTTIVILLLGLLTLSACIPQVAAINSGDNSGYAVGQYTGNWELTVPRTEPSTGTLTINQSRNGSLFGVLSDSVTNRVPIQVICNPLRSTQLSCFSTSIDSASLTLAGNIGPNGYSGLWLAIDAEGEKQGIFNFQRVIR